MPPKSRAISGKKPSYAEVLEPLIAETLDQYDLDYNTHSNNARKLAAAHDLPFNEANVAWYLSRRALREREGQGPALPAAGVAAANAQPAPTPPPAVQGRLAYGDAAGGQSVGQPSPAASTSEPAPVVRTKRFFDAVRDASDQVPSGVDDASDYVPTVVRPERFDPVRDAAASATVSAIRASIARDRVPGANQPGGATPTTPAAGSSPASPEQKPRPGRSRG